VLDGLALFLPQLSGTRARVLRYAHYFNDAGIAGGVLIFSGLMGAGITAGLLDT